MRIVCSSKEHELLFKGTIVEYMQSKKDYRVYDIANWQCDLELLSVMVDIY